MRKIIAFDLLTVDGFFAGPKGEIDWHNYDDEMGTHSLEQMKSLGALIFGRTTYEMMANYWPTPDGVKVFVWEITTMTDWKIFTSPITEKTSCTTTTGMARLPT